MLGSGYTDEEIEAAVKSIHDSMDWSVSFGFAYDEIVEFEERFSVYCGTEYGVSSTSAGAGLQIATMALDLEPERPALGDILSVAGKVLHTRATGADQLADTGAGVDRRCVLV